METSNIIVKQTKLAIQYLEKAEPVIIKKELSAVPRKKIDKYEEYTKKIVPPDFRYWLTNHGAGVIRFADIEFNVPSVEKLLEDDGRLTEESCPANCWKRIFLTYGGAPTLTAIDSTIINNEGLAPVIRTEFYGNKVDKVLASSFPMYIILNIIESCRMYQDLDYNSPIFDREETIEDRADINMLSDSQQNTIHELAASNFSTIDFGIEAGHDKAMKHNETCLGDGDKEPGYVELNRMLEIMKSLNT